MGDEEEKLFHFCTTSVYQIVDMLDFMVSPSPFPFHLLQVSMNCISLHHPYMHKLCMHFQLLLHKLDAHGFLKLGCCV